MWEWLIPLLIVVAILVLIGIYFWVSYHSLKQLNQKAEESWQQLDGQLKARASAVPALVHQLREYAPHERAVYESATRAQSQSMVATQPSESALSAGQLQEALQALLAITDAYPKLSQDADFLANQATVTSSSEQIQTLRRNYNGGVREYNTKLRSFPNSLYAHRFGHDELEFFEITGIKLVAEAPKIQF